MRGIKKDGKNCPFSKFFELNYTSKPIFISGKIYTYSPQCKNPKQHFNQEVGYYYNRNYFQTLQERSKTKDVLINDKRICSSHHKLSPDFLINCSRTELNRTEQPNTHEAKTLRNSTNKNAQCSINYHILLIQKKLR